MENEEKKAHLEAHHRKEMESLREEVARLTSLLELAEDGVLQWTA